MPQFFNKLLIGLILFCLTTPGLYGQGIIMIENEDDELDKLLTQAMQGEEEAITIISDYIFHKEQDTEAKSEYIKALVLVAQAGIPYAQEIFYKLVTDYGYETSFHVATTEAFMTLLPVFEDIIKDGKSSDLLMISAMKAINGVFYMSGRKEKEPLKALHRSLDVLKNFLKDNYMTMRYSDELKLEVTASLGLLLLYEDTANLDDIRDVLVEVLSDPRVSYLSRARLFSSLAAAIIQENSYGIQRSQMAYSLIEELIPIAEEILSDEANWALDDLIARTLRAVEVVASKDSKEAIELIERQIPQFKALFTEERGKIIVESVVNVLIAACVSGSQQATECLVSLINDEAYTEKVKEISIGKLARQVRDGDPFSSAALRKAYAEMAGVNDESLVPFSEFLWPDEKFPYWALKELLVNRVTNSLNPESLLEDSRPLAVMIFAKQGEPETSTSKKLLSPIFIAAGYRVLLYEASTDVELCERAEEATPLDIKADVALIMGHGSSKTGAHLGSLSSSSHELYRLDSSDMEEMRRFGSRLDDDAVVVLFSCSLGKGREDNKDSVPNRFAEAVPHVGMIISADGAFRAFDNPNLTVFEFDSEGKLTNAEFFFNDPNDDMYIIKLNHDIYTPELTGQAVKEDARVKLTTVGEVKAQDNSPAIQTQLLPNYPNPCNPETWMPFHLARSSDLNVRIYDPAGRLIRSIALGHRTPGIYVDKARAIYWDGRNESGEEVASGIYFYSITAGDFFATRKMIVKR